MKVCDHSNEISLVVVGFDLQTQKLESLYKTSWSTLAVKKVNRSPLRYGFHAAPEYLV